MFRIIGEKKIFDDGLIIQKGEITNGKKKFSRYCLKRENVASVFIFNRDSRKFIFTKQFRYPVSNKIKGNLLEIVAGKIEKKEKPLETAIREVKEEIGYKIKPKNIRFLFSCFSSPGYSSEKFFIYYGTVTNEDKVTAGGGNKAENEYIDIEEMKIKKFRKLVTEGKIKDAKTYLAGMYLEIHKYFL